jgi:hypothetical protein
MYGVPADLPLNQLIGKTIDSLVISMHQISFILLGQDAINVQGGWELRDRAALVVDSGQDHDGRDCYRIHRIIDVPIVGFAIDPPRSLTLVFESGHSLEIFDDDEHYESVQVHLEGSGTFII